MALHRARFFQQGTGGNDSPAYGIPLAGMLEPTNAERMWIFGVFG